MNNIEPILILNNLANGIKTGNYVIDMFILIFFPLVDKNFLY